jgi:omega-6 fatty acid desaturase (delta-12 desaturase)
MRRIKELKRLLVSEHSKSNDFKGLSQFLTTIGALALLWSSAVLGLRVSVWLTIAIVPLISLFTLRVFALMHECGHGSLFRSPRLNRSFGFLLGVVAGMPQYVWSQNHSYHHAHNGNWDAYRGPYTTLSVHEYAALSPTQQRLYRVKCSVACAPIAGFIYLIFNPRYTWMKGTLGLLWHVVTAKLAQPHASVRELAAGYKTRYWKSWREYRHMSFNNIVLLSVWVGMCSLMGAGLFFALYLTSLSLAGAAGIVLFTVQHNFPHSHASDAPRWDYDVGAIQGTSFLVLPRWLNWFTANIGYHHVHHLSSRIPNYRLIRCHEEYQQLFTDVTRVKLWEVSSALKCILWDTRAQQIISVAEYRQQLLQAQCA